MLKESISCLSPVTSNTLSKNLLELNILSQEPRITKLPLWLLLKTDTNLIVMVSVSFNYWPVSGDETPSIRSVVSLMKQIILSVARLSIGSEESLPVFTLEGVVRLQASSISGHFKAGSENV